MARAASMGSLAEIKREQQVEGRVRGVGNMEGASEMLFSLEDQGKAPRRVAMVVDKLNDDGESSFSQPSQNLPCSTIGFSGGAASDASTRHDDSGFKAVSSLKRREGIIFKVNQWDYQVVAACDTV